MNKEKKQKNDSKKNALVKPMTSDEIRAFITTKSRITVDPVSIFEDISGEIIPKIKADKQPDEEGMKLVKKALMTLGLENQYPLAEIACENYQGLIIEFARNLIKEYDCKSTSEKALVQVIAIAYIRILECSKRFNGSFRTDSTSNEKNGYYNMLDKELDRANRHFLVALQTLKQFKSPSPELNIKANNAFVSQNQQINAVSGDLNIKKDISNENNTSK